MRKSLAPCYGSAMLARRFSSLLAALAMLSLAGGCEDRKPPPPELPGEPDLPPRPPKRDADSATPEVPDIADAAAAAANSAAERVVADFRSQKLDVASRRVPSERLAFGKERLAQLTDSALVVRDAKSFKVTSSTPITEPRRVVTLHDGSFFVAGKSESLRVPSDPMKTDHFGRVPLFLDSLLFADKRDKNKVWALHSLDPTLFPYQVDELGKLETLDLVPLPKLDQKGFSSLKDGSFVYTAGGHLERFFPGGKTWELELPSGAEVWRILTTKRIDQLWLARADGKLELVQIAADKLAVEKTLEAPGAFDIASNDTDIALLRLETGAPVRTEDGGTTTGRSWKLVVFDASGKEGMTTELPLDSVVGSGEDWVREITKNRAVVLSPYAPLVAVGGPTWLAVWNYKKNERVLAPSDQ
jgi:hypothetical protein